MPEVNFLAVFVVAIVSMGFGALWYSPLLFGKLWAKLSGATDMSGAGKGYVLGFLAALVTSYVMALFVGYTGATTALAGSVTGFWLWLGFIATTTLGSVLWEKKPFKLYVLNNAYYLILFDIMGAILAVWV